MIVKYEKMLCVIINWFVPKSNTIFLQKKNSILSVLMGAIAVCAMFYMSAPISVHLLIKCVIGTLILGLIIFFSINGEVKPVNWDKKIVTIWLIFGVFRLLSGIFVSREYLPLACVWLFVFPSLFLVWNNRKDYIDLFLAAYNGFVYPIALFIIASFFLVPITDEAFGGLTGNPNAIGQLVCVLVPLVVYKYNEKSISLKGKVISVFFLGISGTVIFYSRSRTTTLVVIGVIVFLITYTVFYKKESVMKIVRNLFVIILSSVVLTTGIARINQEIFSREEKVENKNSMDGYVDRITGADKHNEGIENYSSGRTGIWKAVIRETNILGHPSKEHIKTGRNGDVGANAHNNFLQFTYDNGVIAGVLFLMLIVLASIKTLQNIQKFDPEWELVLYVSVAYGIMALVTSINLPFLYLMSFLYYICFAPIFEGEKSDSEMLIY